MAPLDMFPPPPAGGKKPPANLAAPHRPQGLPNSLPDSPPESAGSITDQTDCFLFSSHDLFSLVEIL